MPQVEDGYTRLANEILENIMKASLNGTQFRIVMAVWRYTYGFQRKEHDLSLTFLAKAIDASRGQVDRELTALIDRKIITVVGTGGRGSRVIAFNKDHSEWIDRPLISGLSANPSTEPSSTVSTVPSSTSRTKKENIKEKKKNTRQPKKYAEDSTYFKMAVYFHEKVTAVAKAEGLAHLVIKADLQKWADEFRKLVEIDKVEDKRLIAEVIDWVTSDPFWKVNVLSAKKLRDKFGELALKMKAAQKPPERKQAKPDPRDREIALQRWIAEGKNPDEFNWAD
ncbi:replication protein [Brevibacillus sp. HD3.3A]|uniref:replication protein n=1 Tax=Brevibacillus sp. HD3.3A TaxID=2738979 RepID=UPI00156AAC9E|nr:replication protein [Brevibacillus sp. HD3.3A]UED70740.1 replication protein [Brevibacillus sp. HD3.3A]